MKTIILRHFDETLILDQDTHLQVCPDFINLYGLAYYLTSWRTLKEEFPQLAITLSIPCSANAGLAIMAIQAKVTHISIDKNNASDKIINLAKQQGVMINIGDANPIFTKGN